MKVLISNLTSKSTLAATLVVSVFLFWLSFVASGLGRAEVSAFYSGVTALVSISAGFIAALYFFVAARSTVFLEQIRNTPTFQTLIKLVRHALMFSLISVAICLTNMVLSPVLTFPLRLSDIWAIFSIVFLSYVFGSFWRCMLLFRQLTK
jgi:hypothetical protein